MSDDLRKTVLKLRTPGETPPLVLGAMNFGKRTPEAESRSILARALELGIVHLDTANAYGEGISVRSRMRSTVLGKITSPPASILWTEETPRCRAAS